MTAPITLPFDFREIDGLKIRYAISPKANAPMVLLLSPFPQSILAYHNIWADLENHFHLVAVDLPGFGGSDGDVAVMNIPAQALWLQKIIAALGLTKPHVIGPDVGTPVALAYAANGGEVSSLMIGDGPGVYPALMGKPIQRMMDSALWRWLYALDANQFMRATFKMCYRQYQPNEQEMQDYIAAYKGRMKAAMHWFSTYHQDLPKLHSQLTQIQVPVKIFWGEEDEIVLPATADRLHQQLKNSSIQVFKGAGHFSYQDAASDFSKMVINWVSGEFSRNQS